MKELLNKVNSILKPAGYRMKGMAFWKIDNGFYKLIDFQKGAYQGDYFFINLCVHPVGLPKLKVKQLSIIEKPKEYECIIRQRIEQVIHNDGITKFREGFVSSSDNEIINTLINCLPEEVDQWLNYWGKFENLANANKDLVLNMLTVVPKLKEKAFYMLKFYCFIKLLNKEKAVTCLNQYSSIDTVGLDFSILDNHLNSLLEGLRVTH